MQKNKDLVILGDAIRLERLKRKWSQEYLASIAGLSNGARVSKLEKGDIDIRCSTLFAILRALNIRLEDLIDLQIEQ